MSELLTPKQVARALGISESSLKRWCDSGRLPAIRTAGGHRRLRRTEIVRMVRDGELNLEVPEALGLPASAGRGQWNLNRAQTATLDALVAGDVEVLRQIAFDLFLCGHSLAKVCDSVLAPAMREIGVLWETGKVDVYQERRATLLISRVLHHMQQSLSRPLPNAPMALGGAPEGDPYALPTQMLELVLHEIGWNATSLGGPVPFESLSKAALAHSPRLFWLTVSHIEDKRQFLREYKAFYDDVGDKTAVVVGGRALDKEMRSQMSFASFCEDLSQIQELAKALQPQPVKLPPTSKN